MKQRIKKTFNVKDARNGATVETKDGHSIRILCYDRRCVDYPIIALVNFDKNDQVFSYNIDGILYNSTNDNKNLIIIDEIESKFDEGDYIVSEIGNIYKITKIDDRYHIKQLSSGYEQKWNIKGIDENFHKWSLNDAKPADVLIDIQSKKPFLFKDCSDEEYPNYPVAYCGINCSNMFKVPEGNHRWTSGSIRPANKKEKELFYNKLKEAGYKWNRDTLTLSKIEKWRDNQDADVNGYFIDTDSTIINHSGWNIVMNYNVFATEKQAKAALAMARISQIMANDKRFGGAIANNEWGINRYCVILRRGDTLEVTTRNSYEYLAFHSMAQAELFLKENEDLIKDYYMLD